MANGFLKAAVFSMLLIAVPSMGMAADMKHGEMKHDQMAKGVHASNIWSRATAPSAKTGAVFLELTNMGETPDLLVAATSDIAEKTELHTHLMDNGVMRMRRVEGFEVSPGAPTVLQPGGHHIMLIGLNRPLVEGTMFPVILTFRDAGKVELEVMVGPAGARSSGGGHGGHGSHGHGGS